MSDKIIKVEHLTKQYKLYNNKADRLREALSLTKKKYHKPFYALKDVSFEVGRGETIGIIGVNGSGKSTLLKILTGVINPTMGNVSINGRVSALLELGAGFNMEYTGLENIDLHGTMQGFSKEEMVRRREEIIAFADIGDFIHQPVKNYSSGMFVKLAFSVAINIDPEILIVDEALSVGDIFFQAKCYRKFEAFKEQGKTIIIVSHDLGSISKYCDRVLVMHQGSLVEEGSPKEMIDIYKKILVNQYENDPAQDDSAAAQSTMLNDGQPWKSRLELNQEVLDYGDYRAKIIDFAVIDSRGVITNTIHKGETFEIRMKIQFEDAILEPIYAFTIKDLHGTDLTGTNTSYEKVNVTAKQQGDCQTVSFVQRMDLNGGQYLLSLGCTGFSQSNFEVYHRLYDVCGIIVVSDKNTVGCYDMNSEVKLLD